MQLFEMPMSMMDIWPVRVRVGQSRMGVDMVVRLLSLSSRMQMLVMLIVHVPMAVGQNLVGVLVFVRFMGQDPKPKPHDRGRSPLKVTWALPQYEQSEEHSKKRSYGKVGARSRRSELSKCEDKKNQTHAVTKRTDRERLSDSQRTHAPAYPKTEGQRYVEAPGNPAFCRRKNRR